MHARTAQTQIPRKTIRIALVWYDPPYRTWAPQGSVLFPTLFHIALAGLPRLPDQIPYVAHATYADDITIWSTLGSDGAIQDRLQKAVDTVVEYAKKGGLQCAPQKSELIVIRSRSNSLPSPIIVHVDGIHMSLVSAFLDYMFKRMAKLITPLAFYLDKLIKYCPLSGGFQIGAQG